MLAKKSYSIAEMEELLRTKGKQNIDRKLERYAIDFSSEGYGASRIYTIKHMMTLGFLAFLTVFVRFSSAYPSSKAYLKKTL